MRVYYSERSRSVNGRGFLWRSLPPRFTEKPSGSLTARRAGRSPCAGVSRGCDVATTSALPGLLAGALAHRLVFVQMDLARAVDEAVHDRVGEGRVPFSAHQ